MVYVAGWGELLVWNTETGVLEMRWAGFDKRFSAIDLSEDDRWLAVSSGQPSVSGSVYLIDLDHPTHAMRVWTTTDLPPTLRFSPNSKTLAIGSMTGQLVLVDVQTQKIEREELAHADQILAVEWNNDSSRWITGSRDRTARISEYPSGELKVALGGHERSVCGVGFTSLGPITRDETGTLRLWSQDDTGRALTKRSDLPPRLQPIFMQEDLVRWPTTSQWMAASPTKTVVEEKEKDEKGNPKTKTNYALQKQDAVDLPNEVVSVHRINARGWIGLLTKTGHLYLEKETGDSEITLKRLYP
jgi:WD40 repeat protein